MKVIIADPDWRFASQAFSFLESRAHMVAHYNDIEAVVAGAKKWQPDLVMVSAELATDKAMNTLRSMSPRPAILLTGSMAEPGQTWRAWQRGGDELLMKPVFKAKEIHEAIVSALQTSAVGGRSSHLTAASA